MELLSIKNPNSTSMHKTARASCISRRNPPFLLEKSGQSWPIVPFTSLNGLNFRCFLCRRPQKNGKDPHPETPRSALPIFRWICLSIFIILYLPLFETECCACDADRLFRSSSARNGGKVTNSANATPAECRAPWLLDLVLHLSLGPLGLSSAVW